MAIMDNLHLDLLIIIQNFKDVFFFGVPGSQMTDTLDSKWIGEAHIEGSDTVYAHIASPVTLTCKILPLSPQTSIYFSVASTVRWLKDNKEIGNNVSPNHLSIRPILTVLCIGPFCDWCLECEFVVSIMK